MPVSSSAPSTSTDWPQRMVLVSAEAMGCEPNRCQSLFSAVTCAEYPIIGSGQENGGVSLFNPVLSRRLGQQPLGLGKMQPLDHPAVERNHAFRNVLGLGESGDDPPGRRNRFRRR